MIAAGRVFLLGTNQDLPACIGFGSWASSRAWPGLHLAITKHRITEGGKTLRK